MSSDDSGLHWIFRRNVSTPHLSDFYHVIHLTMMRRAYDTKVNIQADGGKRSYYYYYCCYAVFREPRFLQCTTGSL